MAKQFSKTAIGGFVVGAIALLLACVMVFGSGRFFVKKDRYVMFFSGSVRGLTVGAPVVFRGVEIGSVARITILEEAGTLELSIPVIVDLTGQIERKGVQIEDDEQYMLDLIEKGLRAQLTLQSLVTGQLMIELDFHPNTPAKLVASNGPYMEIPTIPSTIQQLAQKLEELPVAKIADKLLEVAEGLDQLLRAPALRESLQNIDAASQQASHLINDARTLVQNIDRKVAPLADSLQDAARQAQRLLRHTDAQIDPLTTDARRAMQAGEELLQRAHQTLTTVEGLVGERSEVRYNLNLALEEIRGAARSMRKLSNYLERHPEALLQGKSGPPRR